MANVQRMSSSFTHFTLPWWGRTAKQKCLIRCLVVTGIIMIQMRSDIIGWSGQKPEEIWKQSCFLRSWPLFISSPPNMSHSISSKPILGQLRKSLTTQWPTSPAFKQVNCGLAISWFEPAQCSFKENLQTHSDRLDPGHPGMSKMTRMPGPFLASLDALEVIIVTFWLTPWLSQH